MQGEWIAPLLLALVGTIAGFVNTLAGAGSILTIPMLILVGVPADAANATNRVSVLAQCVSGGVGFHRARKVDWPALAGIVPITVLGALAGAHFAALLPERPMRLTLLAAMVVMGLLLWRKPNVLTPEEGSEALSIRQRPSALAWFLLVGLYGGFLQVGVGLLLLFVLGGLLRYDLVRANALKVVIVGIYTLGAVAIFVIHDKVWWLEGAATAAGTVVGAQLGVRFAVRRGVRTLRVAVLVMVVVSIVAVIAKEGW